MSHRTRRSYSSIFFQTDAAGGLTTPTPGAFPVSLAYNEQDAGPPPANTRWAAPVLEVDGAAMCQITATAYGSGGSVVVTAFPTSGGSAQGTFDISFGSDSLSGSFDAPLCSTIGQSSPCQ